MYAAASISIHAAYTTSVLIALTFQTHSHN
jgi:hypothetical protein